MFSRTSPPTVDSLTLKLSRKGASILDSEGTLEEFGTGRRKLREKSVFNLFLFIYSPVERKQLDNCFCLGEVHYSCCTDCFLQKSQLWEGDLGYMLLKVVLVDFLMLCLFFLRYYPILFLVFSFVL